MTVCVCVCLRVWFDAFFYVVGFSMCDGSMLHLLADTLHRGIVQGEKEKLESLPISPFMDRTQSAALPHMQLNFIEMVVAPAFQRLAQLLPPTAHVLDVLRANVA